jgi:hypothetical protein
MLVLLCLSPLPVTLGAASSCHGQGDKNLVHQTREAGELIERHPASPPEVKQAGGDVRLNMETLAPSVGEPKNPMPYSPQVSAETRVIAKQEQSEPPAALKWLSNIVSPIIPWASPALLGAWGIFERLRRGKALQRLTAVYQGVESVKEKVGGGQYADAITETLRTVAGNMNVYADIKKEISALRESGALSSAKIVAPAAPAPAAAAP